MKFAALIQHGPDQDAVRAIFPEHRAYLRSLLEAGRLVAAGPLTQQAGALWILEAETLPAAEDLIRADPSHAAGVFVGWQVYPLAYWSAKEAKGA